MNSIVDLIQDALQQIDYKFRINFLIAGLICEEENDTPEKRKTNREYLLEINQFIDSYSGESDIKAFLSSVQKSINKYIEVQE